MNNSKMWLPIQVALGALFSSFLLPACGGDPLPAVDEPAATSTATGKKPTQPKPTSTVPATGPTATATSVPGISHEDLPEPVVPAHEAVIDPDYPGLDVALASDKDVPGCSTGYDADKFTLTLKLSAEVPGVRLSAKDGALLANGRACGKEQNVTLEALERIAVTGGAEDNVVILDLSEGSFGTRLYENAGGFYFMPGEGNDQFLLRGTASDDALFLGSGRDSFMAALTELPRINVWGKKFESVVVSSGPGSDTVEAIGRLNVGLFDVDTGGSIQPTDLALPSKIWGGAGDDTLMGGIVSDFMVGGAGNDTVSGGNGNDIFDEEAGDNGADVINGGEGSDQLDYRLRNEPLKLVLCVSPEVRGCGDACSCNKDNGQAGEGDTLINVERIWGGSGDDEIIGTDADESIYGELGDDKLSGRGGSDVLQGGAGSDELDGGDGGDICDADPEEKADSCEI